MLALQTGTALLGVRLLPPSPRRADAHALHESLRELHRAPSARADGARVTSTLCVHVGQVEVRGEAAEGIEITGRPLSRRSPAGWCATRAVSASPLGRARRPCRSPADWALPPAIPARA